MAFQATLTGVPLCDFWTWGGWSAFVALGTLALAAATGVLAGFTYKVTKLSGREIGLEARRLEAEQRPIVLPAELNPTTIGGQTRALVPMNAGPGAALNVSCIFEWGPPSGVFLKTPLQHIRPGGSVEVAIDRVSQPWENVRGRITCEDLTGHSWETLFTVIPRANDAAELNVSAPTRAST